MRPYRVQIGTRIQLLDGLFQALEAQDQRGDIVEGATGSCSADDDLHTICRSLVLVVLADASFGLVSVTGVITVRHLPLFAFISLATLVTSFSDAHFVR